MDLFCKIINKEIPAKMIYEDNKVLAFMDIKPVNLGHFLVVPKVHSTNLMDINDEELTYLIKKARELANNKIKEMSVSGYQLHVNNSKESGQIILHTHIHIIPSIK